MHSSNVNDYSGDRLTLRLNIVYVKSPIFDRLKTSIETRRGTAFSPDKKFLRGSQMSHLIVNLLDDWTNNL